MKASKKLSEFKKFMAYIHPYDKIAIVHDSDADGLCSAVIVAKAVQRISGKKPELVFFQQHSTVSFQDSTIEKLKKNGITKIIILDIAVDQDVSQIKKAEKYSKILVIDHHKVYNNISSNKTTFLKAKDFSFLDPSNYATAKLSFDLFSEIVNIDDLKWLACIGLMGDYSIKPWKKFLDTTFKETGINKKFLNDMVELISSVESVKIENISLLYKDFFKATRAQDLDPSKYKKDKQKMKTELKRLLIEFQKNKEIFPEQELIFFHFKSNYDIKSILINKMSVEKFPSNTVVVAQDNGKGIIDISARRQDFQVKMNELLEKSVAPFKEGIAGGHIPAAGGKINKKDFKQFKENIIKNLSK